MAPTTTDDAMNWLSFEFPIFSYTVGLSIIKIVRDVVFNKDCGETTAAAEILEFSNVLSELFVIKDPPRSLVKLTPRTKTLALWFSCCTKRKDDVVFVMTVIPLRPLTTPSIWLADRVEFELDTLLFSVDFIYNDRASAFSVDDAFELITSTAVLYTNKNHIEAKNQKTNLLPAQHRTIHMSHLAIEPELHYCTHPECNPSLLLSKAKSLMAHS